MAKPPVRPCPEEVLKNRLVLGARDQGRVDRAIRQIEGWRPGEAGSAIEAGEDEGQKHGSTFAGAVLDLRIMHVLRHFKGSAMRRMNDYVHISVILL